MYWGFGELKPAVLPPTDRSCTWELLLLEGAVCQSDWPVEQSEESEHLSLQVSSIFPFPVSGL